MNSEKRFLTIREAAAAGYDTEFHLRQLLKQGKLPGFFSGRTFKVNVKFLIELLDRESVAQASGVSREISGNSLTGEAGEQEAR